MGFSGRGKWETEEIVALSSYWVHKRLLAYLLDVTPRAELGLACQGDCGGEKLHCLVNRARTWHENHPNSALFHVRGSVLICKVAFDF